MEGFGVKFNEILKTLEENKERLRKKYKVKEIGIFHYTRSEQRETSDVDILVEFEETPTLLEFIELENYLTEIPGVKVDLVMKRALKPRIRENVLKGVVYV